MYHIIKIIKLISEVNLWISAKKRIFEPVKIN